MIRVFQVDLLQAANHDLFTVELPPQSISMRYADSSVARAVLEDRAEYKGYLVVGDEIDVRFEGALSGQVKEFVDFFAADAEVNPAVVSRWVVDGFFNGTQLRLRPGMLSSEGIEKIAKNGIVVPVAIGKIINRPGWLPTVNSLSAFSPSVIRRNALGEPRWKSVSGLPVSWRWQS